MFVDQITDHCFCICRALKVTGRLSETVALNLAIFGPDN